MTIAVCHPEILIEYLFLSTDSNGANVCNACDEDFPLRGSQLSTAELH